MKFVTLKSHTELPPLFGPEFVFENNSLKEVRFNDGAYVIKPTYNALEVLHRKMFDEVERFAVRGSVAGIKVEELLEEEYQAQQRASELNAATGYKSEFTVEPVKVLVDEQGQVRAQMLSVGACALPRVA